MPRKGRRDCRNGTRKKGSIPSHREEVIKSIRKVRKDSLAASQKPSAPRSHEPAAPVVRGVGGSSRVGRVAASEAQLDGQFAEPGSSTASQSYLAQMRAEVGAFAAETRRKYSDQGK
eukprot:scaffold73262_cov32-Tisochrysis_lutea.AAC.4